MRVLLIQPPIEDFYQTDIRLQPIGLAYLKAAVRRHLPSVEVKILDFHHGYGRKTLRWPKEFEYLRPYYGRADQSPFSTFHNYFRFGATVETIANEIRDYAPDVVGISSLFTPYYREVLEVARITRVVTPSAAIVVGGSHASASPKSLLNDLAVDVVILGEGEKPLVELLGLWQNSPRETWTKLASSVSGTVLRSAGTHLPAHKPEASNFEITELPFPDLSDFALDKYRMGAKPLCFMITSRSCPHRCSFCSVHTTFGTTYRRRSVDDIFAEIFERYTQGYRIIDFEDDNLTFFKDEMKQLCRRISTELPPHALELVAMNGISYLSLDSELLELMKAAGFSTLNLALVSSDQSVLSSTKRPHTVEKYVRVIEMAHRLGLSVTSYQILGLPNETLESQIQTLVFNSRFPVLLGASPFYLTPNSPIARQLRFSFVEEDFFRSRLTAMAYTDGHVSRDQLYTLFVSTRILNFLKEPTHYHPTLQINSRQMRGWTIFNHLLKERVLLGFDGQNYYPHEHFLWPVFEQILNQLDFVTRRDGSKVWIHDLLSRKTRADSPEAFLLHV